MDALAASRFLSLFVIAILGVLGQIGVAPVGLPALPPEALSHGWERFYSPIREFGFLAVFLAGIIIALSQYKNETSPGTLLLTPIAVVLYLALPHFLPEDLAAGVVAVFLLLCLFAIVLGTLADIQPETPGRPAYISALGFVLALVMYLGSLGAAVSIPGALLGEELTSVRWGVELLAVLVVPAFLIFTPLFKAIWTSPETGFWFR